MSADDDFNTHSQHAVKMRLKYYMDKMGIESRQELALKAKVPMHVIEAFFDKTTTMFDSEVYIHCLSIAEGLGISLSWLWEAVEPMLEEIR